MNWKATIFLGAVPLELSAGISAPVNAACVVAGEIRAIRVGHKWPSRTMRRAKVVVLGLDSTSASQ